MTNDEHVMETFGPLYDDMPDAIEQGGYNEGHYYATLRDFEELVAEYGLNNVMADLDQEILGDMLDYVQN